MIDIQRNDDVLTLTINRPDKANSLTAAMLGQLADAVADFDGKVLILTGAGKVFSAGADLDAAKAGLAVDPVWERLSQAIATFDGFSIAALNGTMAGGACGMALACDLRLAVPHTKVFYPVMRLGFLPQPSDPPRLVKLVGPSRAKLILMAGQKITAEEALGWGLVDRIVAPEDVLDAAHELAADCLAADASHISGIKDLIDG
ncbi:MAG: enoyl-CoA hydratase/isomerase family protein [Pseudomonadota bacterium]